MASFLLFIGAPARRSGHARQVHYTTAAPEKATAAADIGRKQVWMELEIFLHSAKRTGDRSLSILCVWPILRRMINFPLALEKFLCYAPFNTWKGAVTAMQNMMTSVYMNTAAYAQDTCAASSCAAMNSIILVLDAGLLLASIIILLAFASDRMTVHRSPLRRLAAQA